MMEMPGKPWNTSHLKKRESIYRVLNGFDLSVSHEDRTLDPYLGVVLKDGRILITGLFPTLSRAREWCEEQTK